MFRDLTALAVPTGWMMLFNNFVRFEEDEELSDDDLDLYLTQDILAMRLMSSASDGCVEREGALRIFLGWYPDMDRAGRYRLDLSRNGAVDEFAQFESRSPHVIRSALEQCLVLGARGAEDDEITHALDKLA